MLLIVRSNVIQLIERLCERFSGWIKFLLFMHTHIHIPFWSTFFLYQSISVSLFVYPLQWKCANKIWVHFWLPPNLLLLECTADHYCWIKRLLSSTFSTTHYPLLMHIIHLSSNEWHIKHFLTLDTAISICFTVIALSLNTVSKNWAHGQYILSYLPCDFAMWQVFKYSEIWTFITNY